MADTLEEKAQDIKTAIVGLWEKQLSISDLGSNIYQCETTSNHNLVSNSNFSDKITIYDSNDSDLILNTNYLQFDIHELTSDTVFKVFSPDIDLTTFTTPKLKLFSGHTQVVFQNEFKNDGQGVYPISQPPCIIVIVSNYLYQKRTVQTFNAFRVNLDIYDEIANHNLNNYNDNDLLNSTSIKQASHFVGNRMNYIISKLRLTNIESRNYFDHYGNYAREIRGETLNFTIEKNLLLKNCT
jgi:hypothetical protein